MRLSVILAVLILAGCAAPADDAAKDTYSQNLATAKKAVQAHINADYDAWMECHAADAVIMDAGYGTTGMTPQEAATAFAGHHDAFDGISTSREIWLPGVDTLNLAADGSVRAYINWSATSKANGHEVNLRAYHYWNFNDEGKIMQEGGFYDAGGLAVAATTMPPTEEGEGEE